MERFAPFTNRGNYFNNQKQINIQKLYNFRNLNPNLKNNNNNFNNNININNNINMNNNMGNHFNNNSKISRQDMKINKTPKIKGQYSNKIGYPYNKDSTMKEYNFNSPPAPLVKNSNFPGLNNIQPFNLNNNYNRYQNQPINTNNNNIELNNNINTNKSKDNKINNFINNNKNNNNNDNNKKNTTTRSQDNLTSNEEEYTLEVLKSRRIFKTKTKNYNQVPINQKLQVLKNRDNNTDEENNNFCKGNFDNNNINTVFYINKAFNAQK